ncbi:MAG: hypothetical protein KJ574_04925 [Nanoarchaeota archaeon]|nr:hypothetical protein [Nanoarchaeota archaeon]
MRCEYKLFLGFLLLAVLLLAGCSQSQSKGGIYETKQKAIRATSAVSLNTATCTEHWGCNGNTRYFITEDCTHDNEEYCENGCADSECLTTEIQTTEEETSTTTSNIPREFLPDPDLEKTDIYEMTEGDEDVINVAGELVYVRVLVIDEVDRRVKFKINNARSFGLKEGNMIILKDEEDDEDELYIEVVDLQSQTYGGVAQKKVFFRLAKLIE